MADLADYEWLTSAEAAGNLNTVSRGNEPIHQRLMKLRKTLSPERAGLIMQQIELRQRAQSKFGDLALSMFFNDLAFQQATDRWTAKYKAASLPVEVPVNDYCCGIGGDLLAFAQRGPTTGWDWTAEIAHLANANLHAAKLEHASSVRTGDVARQTPASGTIWHLDPDRRVDGRRSTQIQWHSPGPELVDRWLATNPNGLLKLAPATVVPESWRQQGELEWITFNRECRQQVVWFGQLANKAGQHRATLVSKDRADEQKVVSNSFVGCPNKRAATVQSVLRYVYDTDPAVRAAHLIGALADEYGLHLLADGNSYLTSDLVVANPLLSCFEVLDQLPLRVATLKQHLRNLNVGQLEIKKRGIDTDPEQLRKQLRLPGEESATLLLTRSGIREIALIAKRVEG